MIEIIKGEIVGKGDSFLILQTGGVGLKVWTTNSIASDFNKNEIANLYTDLILRENDVSLYGFLDIGTRNLFRILIKVNGVGPKAALSILSSLSLQNIYQAIQKKDFQPFLLAPGVGNKTAQKIVLHLQDKLDSNLINFQLESIDDLDTDLLDALVGLGYSVVEGQACIQSLPKDAPIELEEKLRLALKYFS
jgi:holliday junction DNA helicase RuvA